MSRRSIIALVLAVAFVAMCAPAAAAHDAEVRVGGTNPYQIPSVGYTVKVPIHLSSPNGISSDYRITVTLSNPSVAEITAAWCPEGVTVSSLPAGAITLYGEPDRPGTISHGATIAWLTIKGKAIGATNIVITPDPTRGIVDMSGVPYDVTTQGGTVLVLTDLTTPKPTIPFIPISTPRPTPTPTIPFIPISTPPPPTPIVPDIPPPTATPILPTPSPMIPVTTPIQPIGTPAPVIIQPVAVIPTVPPAGQPVVPVAVTTPQSVVQPVAGPTLNPANTWGKRYAVGNPGSYLGSRFSTGTAPTGTSGRRAVTTTDTVLKPGARSYGITPPASGSFVRWYPAARWAAGIR